MVAVDEIASDASSGKYLEAIVPSRLHPLVREGDKDENVQGYAMVLRRVVATI